MPLIFAVHCTACDFKTASMSSATAVVDLDSGEEAICPHPLERRTAEDLTGRGWPELVRAGRIGYQYPLTCKICGTTDYYRTSRSFRRGPFAGLIGGITHVPSAEQAAKHVCLSCGKQGQLVAATKLGTKFWNAKAGCPKCHQALSVQILGRS